MKRWKLAFAALAWAATTPTPALAQGQELPDWFELPDGHTLVEVLFAQGDRLDVVLRKPDGKRFRGTIWKAMTDEELCRADRFPSFRELSVVSGKFVTGFNDREPRFEGQAINCIVPFPAGDVLNMALASAAASRLEGFTLAQPDQQSDPFWFRRKPDNPKQFEIAHVSYGHDWERGQIAQQSYFLTIVLAELECRDGKPFRSQPFPVRDPKTREWVPAQLDFYRFDDGQLQTPPPLVRTAFRMLHGKKRTNELESVLCARFPALDPFARR